MANNPTKMKDPTETALSAIEEAIQVRDEQATNGRSTSPGSADSADILSESRRRPSRTDDDLFLDETVRPASRSDEQPSGRRAANDDRQSIGQILQAVQRRPSRKSYAIATLFALGWLTASVAVTWLYMPDLQQSLAQGQAPAPVLLGLGALILVPVIFFYALAHMIWRSQELRLIAQSMAEVAVRLAEPETASRDSIVSVGQAIRREVAAMGDGVERALARAAELEALVHNEVSALERAYNDNEVRIRGLLQDLAGQRDTLVSQAEQVRNAITSVHLELSHDITAVSDLVSDKVNETAQRITRTLADKGEHITLALGHAGDSMIAALTERGGDLLGRLEHTSEETTRAITSASERLTTSLNFKTDHIHEEFAGLATNLTQMVTSQLSGVARDFQKQSETVMDGMASRTQQMAGTIIDSSATIAETIANRVEEANSTLKATGDSLVLDLSLRGSDVVANLEQTGARITDALISRSANVTDTFRDSADSLGQVIEAKGDAVKNMLAARLLAFEEMFTHGGAELGEKITRDSITLGNLITRHLTEFDRTVKTYGGELVDRLGDRTQEVAEAMRIYIDSFDSRVSTKTGEISETLDQRLLRFQEALDGRTQTLNDALSSRMVDIATTLAEGGKEVVASLDQRIDQVTDTLSNRGAQLAEIIAAKIGDIDRALGSRAADVANNLDARVDRIAELNAAIETNAGDAEHRLTQLSSDIGNMLLQNTGDAERRLTELSSNVSRTLHQNTGDAERRLTELSSNVSNMLLQNTDEAGRSLTELSSNVSNILLENAGSVERTLLGVSAEVAREFLGKAEEISSALSKRTAEMTRIIDQNSGGLLAALTDKSQEFASQLGRATDQALKEIETKGFAFTRAMMTNSDEIARNINDASATAATAVTRTLQQLQDTTHSAIEQSKQTAATTVSEMLETHGMLRSDTTTLFERLREANILLQEVLSGAHENMSSLEQTMVTRVSEFVSTMNELTERSGTAGNQVEEHIGKFHNVTTKALGELSQLSAQFETHGRGLAQAVDLIDRSNRRTEDSLSERRASLDSVLATLDDRTEDLEQRLKRFSGLLDESLDAAANRARDIARVVSDASVGGAQAISEQFEMVRSTAEEERKRTAQTMRGIYEEATGDADTMLRQTTERFSEIVHGMKHMAAEMQRELEATRVELRRGILELPQETAESTAQMRRVIVDQIEALAELNRIVARHGRGLDTAEPGRRAPAGREDNVLTGTAGRHEAMRSNMNADITGVASAPSRRAEAPSLTPAAGKERSGWLTDLLSRASREDGDPPPELPRESMREMPRDIPRGDERTARHSIESLDSLSVDIARMIDHDAAAELWDKYKRGERNVFTRRLYTLQGQKAFDEIRKKYRADREFKQTIDRYIAEFERLLEEVSRDDRGQVVARTYLTSETGKVYTMLAHAAGRFE
jgi:hypothetical protein